MSLKKERRRPFGFRRSATLLYLFNRDYLLYAPFSFNAFHTLKGVIGMSRWVIP